MNDFDSVKEAFSRQAVNYDFHEEGNQILKWMRNKIREHMLSILNPGDRILEINAGTGLDAVFFAKNSFQIYATDISDGMIKKMKYRINELSLMDRITVKQCSFTELKKIDLEPFDHIFSNFGGLNCLSDLGEATRSFSSLLKPNGKVTLVIMPPICPWELSHLFKGKLKTGFRRFKKKGTSAHIEGIYFNCYYHTTFKVLKALGKEFKKVSLKSLSLFVPPPYMKNFPAKYPKVFKILKVLDEKLSGFYPLNTIGDHYILTAEFKPFNN